MENTTSQAPAAAAPTEPRSHPVQRVLAAIGPQNLSLLVALLVLVAIFGSLRPDAFFSPRNATAILNAITILGIVAMAQTVVIISGGIDVSVGSIVGMASVVAALAMSSIDSAAIGILAAILVGGLGGLVNGLLVTKGRVNPIITTLATLAIFQGVAYIVSNGKAIGVLNTDFNWIGAGRIAGVPMTVIVFSVIAVLMVYFMRATDMGRNIYAIGGNPNAARLAGIRLERYRIGVYTLTGLICGVAAVLLTARSTSGQPSSGSAGLELEAITAAFLGGCAMAGGRGTIIGTILGVLIIGTLNNGMLLMMVPNFYQLLAKGVLLLGAVMIMEFRTRRPA
jgi:ribose/xylose/arabinose/galactoside ABC-type transport system permease subunit